MLTQKVKNWGHGLDVEEDFEEENIILEFLELDEEHVHQTDNLGIPRGDDDVAYSFVIDIENETVVRRMQWNPAHLPTDRGIPNRVYPGVGQRTLTLHYHEPMTDMGLGPSETSVLATAIKPRLGPDDRALLDAGVPKDQVESVKRRFRKGDKYDAAETAIRGRSLPLEEEQALYDAVVEIFS
jgi:hypothetical protein